MNDRAPRRAVGFQEDASIRDRAGNEVVQHDVEADARRKTVGCRRPEEYRAEIGVGQFGDVTLGKDLRPPVRRHRTKRARLVDKVGGRLAVVAARRRKQETAHAGLLGHVSHMHAAAMIDVVGDVRVEIAQRIVRQRCQVDNRILSCEILGTDIADVLADMWHRSLRTAPVVGASFVEVGIETGDCVPCPEQVRHHHGSEIALVAGNKHAHRIYPFQRFRCCKASLFRHRATRSPKG